MGEEIKRLVLQKKNALELAESGTSQAQEWLLFFLLVLLY